MSVAIPREPEIPTFQVPERLPPPAEPAPEEDEADLSESPPTLTDVEGIGPVYATRLASAGVNTVADLAAADPEQVAKAVEAPVGRVQRWIDAAGGMAGGQRPTS